MTKPKTSIEYAVKTGNWYSDPLSLAKAKLLMKSMEEADRAYDIQNPPRRKIVCREVTMGPWRDFTHEVKESKLKLKPSAITVKVLGVKIKKGDLTVTKGEVF